MQSNGPLPGLPEKQGRYLTRHWRGELKLWLSFWINGVLLSLLVDLALIELMFARFVAGPPNAYGWVSMLALTFAITIVTVWQLVGIWRSSQRHSAGGRPLWGRLARIAVIIAWVKWLRTAWALIFLAGRSF
jgi:hypothetical protein